jgi:hypothetical protein
MRNAIPKTAGEDQTWRYLTNPCRKALAEVIGTEFAQVAVLKLHLAGLPKLLDRAQKI